MIKIKDKETLDELQESAKEFRKGVLKDKRELEDFQESSLLSSMADFVLWAVIVVLDGYFLITEKLSWIILLVITLIILCIYFVYKRTKNDKKKPQILS